MKLGMIGGGRAAWAFGSTWRRIGWPMSGIWLRDRSMSVVPEALGVVTVSLRALVDDSDVLLLAVSDAAIAEVAAALPPGRAVLFHASGALPALPDGFSLHPLRALPPVARASDLSGATFVFEGTHRPIADRIVEAAGGRLIEILAPQKALYHAAAVFGANYVAAAVDIAERLMREAGVEGVRDDLADLAASALANWQQNPGRGRFTGPAARGDQAVLRSHMEALRGQPQLLKIYELLAQEIAGSNLASEE
jgi:predicted short-subunit dehydrogenase-like oxidoreductase (DUF2520 family)